MKNFAGMVLAAVVAASAADVQAESATGPVQQSVMMTTLYPVIVVLKFDLDYSVFAASANVDERDAAAPEAWGYLDRGVVGAVQSLENLHQFRADHVYSHALKGFAARLTEGQLQALRSDPAVERIDADGLVSANAQVLPWGVDKIDADLSSTRAGDGMGAITGVHGYVIDTGASTTHADLNVVEHVNFIGGANADCHGHGTHVSGTVAARDNTIDVVGVAPGMRIHAVKVLDCFGFGSFAAVIKGVDWVTANATKPAVANMSLGGGANDPLDQAVRRSAASGVFYAIAAGNAASDACNSSPARAGQGFFNGIVTVAATDPNDREAAFSNFGQCVDIWAPGVNILSTRLGGGTATLSGTSMAAPHVAGTGALVLSRAPLASPQTVELMLKITAVYPGTLSKDSRSIARVNARLF